jgi:aspartate aminotransferase
MLAERTTLIKGSQTSGMRNRAKRLTEQGVAVVNFAAGELDPDTSAAIKRETKAAVDARRNQYTETMGISELRTKLADKVSAKTGVAYTPEEIGVTAGAKQALYNAAMVLFQPGDEVIIPAPYWVTFPAQVVLAGARPVFLPTEQNDFQIDANALAAQVTPKTRGILLNTPHNPTGVVYEKATLQKIAVLALEKDLVIVFDECYESLVYAPAMHHNIVRLVPDVKGRTVLVNSFSKTYCLTGWRVGYAAAPAPMIKAMSDLQGHATSNPCNLAQFAALAALNPANDPFVEDVRRVLGERRERALAIARQIPYARCPLPGGAFYLFLDVGWFLGKKYQGKLLPDVDAFAETLLEEAHVAVVPGSGFGSARHVRISYAVSTKHVDEGMRRIKHFLEEVA